MPEKRFLTYDQQIELLKSKNLQIENEDTAKKYLARFGYYSLVSGYKDMFKQERNGNYRADASFSKLVSLYFFDDYLKNKLLHELIRVEKHIRSLYSYSFCDVFGDNQTDYLNVNNYNYQRYQSDVNTFISKIQDILSHSENYPYIHYNISTYGTVPLWVLIQSITFGSLSKMYMFSYQHLQSQVSRNFDCIYPNHLCKMLNIMSKFRNVCAHGERLYNFKTRNSILDLPIHNNIENYNPNSKNDVFNLLICFKYLSAGYDFVTLIQSIDEMIDTTKPFLGDYYTSKLLSSMGFPENWKDITK